MQAASSSFLVTAALIAFAACGGGEPGPVTPASTAGPGGAATPPPFNAPVPNGEKTVAELRPDFRKCYNDGLAKDPKIAGTVVITAKIDAKGAVTSATVADGATLPTEVTECITTRLQKATFESPGPTGSTLSIPITFKSAP